MRSWLSSLLVVSGCLVVTHTPPEGEPPITCEDIPEPAPVDYGYPFDDQLRLNHIQAKGTHNSYHIQPEQLFSPEHAYTHEPLDVGLEDLGLRQFELDIHQDEELGAFTVFHIPFIDPLSTCHLLTDCLGLIKAWSDSHPGHLPIFIWVEPKDDIDPAKIDDYDRLDEEIRSVWPEERLFTPDDLQGDYPSIKEALAAEGWPTLGQLRDHLILAMLDSDQHMRNYTRNLTSLRCRAMFVNQSDPESDFASFLKINNPTESRRIHQALASGLIVGSNVDGVDASDEDNAARLQAALENGVNFLSSDLPAPTEGRSYSLSIPDGTPARCNPVTAPAFCTSQAIEDLGSF